MLVVKFTVRVQRHLVTCLTVAKVVLGIIPQVSKVRTRLEAACMIFVTGLLIRLCSVVSL